MSSVIDVIRIVVVPKYKHFENMNIAINHQSRHISIIDYFEVRLHCFCNVEFWMEIYIISQNHPRKMNKTVLEICACCKFKSEFEFLHFLVIFVYSAIIVLFMMLYHPSFARITPRPKAKAKSSIWIFCNSSL